MVKCQQFLRRNGGTQFFFRLSTLCINQQYFAHSHIARLHTNTCNKLFRNISLFEIGGGPERTNFCLLLVESSLVVYFPLPILEECYPLDITPIHHHMSNVEWQPMSKPRLHSCRIRRQPHKNVPFSHFHLPMYWSSFQIWIQNCVADCG